MNEQAKATLNKYKPSQIAKEIGCTRQYFYQIKTGKYKPSLEMAIKIMQATNGLVPVVTWYPNFDLETITTKSAII